MQFMCFFARINVYSSVFSRCLALFYQSIISCFPIGGNLAGPNPSELQDFNRNNENSKFIGPNTRMIITKIY